MPASPKPKKRPQKGIWVPVTSPRSDQGLSIVRHLNGQKIRIWYMVDAKKKYVPLPRGTTVEEARERRDRLYENLKALHGAKARSFAKRPGPEHYQVRLDHNLYIYERPRWMVRIMGRQIGVAHTHPEAVTLRNNWLRANRDKVPNLIGIPDEPTKSQPDNIKKP